MQLAIRHPVVPVPNDAITQALPRKKHNKPAVDDVRRGSAWRILSDEPRTAIGFIRPRQAGEPRRDDNSQTADDERV